MMANRLPSIFVAFFMILSVLVSSGCMQDEPPKDSDNDGHPDSSDAFPDDPNEWSDLDDDGVGDNADDFPKDPSEWVDSDYDGVGDNADAFPDDPFETMDTDGDGVGDNADDFPDDPNETEDSDGDGVGDNADVFPDDTNEWEDPDGDGLGSNYEQQIGTNPNDADTDGDGLTDDVEIDIGTDPNDWDSDDDGISDGAETDTGIWVSDDDTGTDPLSDDTDGDGLNDGRESNSGQPEWVLDEEWTAPTDVNEPYEPEEIFIETDLKVNVVFIGAELEDDEKENIASKVYPEYIPLDHIMATVMGVSDYEALGVEYNLDLSIINAPDELSEDYSAFLNESASRNWTTGSYLDFYGNDYVDDAFDEAFGEDDWSDVLISGINVQDAESWLYWNVPDYEGMEDVYDGYVLYFLAPDAGDVWPYYYYSETNDIDTGEEAVAKNLVAYGGNYPLYFIDLMTPPPSFALGQSGDVANRDNNPPAWLWNDMSGDEIDALIAEYIEEAIQFLFAPSYIYTPEYEYEYELDLILIDATSDDSVYDTMTDYFNAATAQTALDEAVPYTEWTFEILKADIDSEGLEGYKDVLDDTTETESCHLGGDAQIIDSNALIPEVDELIIRPDGIVTIPVFITIFDDCGYVDNYYTMGGAEAYDDGEPFGVFMATGKNQLTNDGLTTVVVHELGHMLGLMHPHQSFGYDTGELGYEQDWFWDQSATTMTYSWGLENAYLDGFNQDALDRGHALVLLDGVQNYRYAIWTELESKGYDHDTVPNDVFQSILEMDQAWDLSIEEFENRNYFSYYSSGYDAVGLAVLSLETAADALEMAQALDDYTPKIWVDLGTDPNNPDTDGDGLEDGVETMTGIWSTDEETGTNPLLYDTDGDGLSDGVEILETYTDPTDDDTDHDGLSDGVETNTGVWVNSSDTGTDPNDADTDGDLLWDGLETNTGIFVSEDDTGTSPLDYDSDGDGLEDGFEVIEWGSDPNLVDTDSDGYDDDDDYWPTFDLQIYITIYYYNVENTDVWTGDDVYFYVNIENTGWELTDTVVDEDEYYVSYNYSHNAADSNPYFFFWIEAWDDDGGDGSGDDQYDIDGRNTDDNRLWLYYYPDSGWVGGDAPHTYIKKSDDDGWTWVITDGSDDGDYGSHDAEIWLIVGWNIV